MINITVTADDFGYCEMRNKGILELCKKGIIHSISLLVNATDSIAAVSAFHQLPIDIKSNISVGLHLNLTEGKPVSERSSIPSLLNDAGNFLGKMEVRKKLDDLLNDEVVRKLPLLCFFKLHIIFTFLHTSVILTMFREITNGFLWFTKHK